MCALWLQENKQMHGYIESSSSNKTIHSTASLDSRPIKIRPGTYCRGDSAHVLQITQNMGNRSLVPRPYFFLLLSLFIHKHKKDIVRQQRKKWAYS